MGSGLRAARAARNLAALGTRRGAQQTNLAEADGAGGASAEGGAVGAVSDTEGAEHASGLAVVLGEGARGPGGGGATEVGAVVPGGAEVAASRGGLGDDGSGPDRLEEGLGVDDLEVGDVRELYRSARAHEDTGGRG